MKKVLESDYFQQVSYLIDERFCLQNIFFMKRGIVPCSSACRSCAWWI